MTEKWQCWYRKRYIIHTAYLTKTIRTALVLLEVVNGNFDSLATDELLRTLQQLLRVESIYNKQTKKELHSRTGNVY